MKKTTKEVGLVLQDSICQSNPLIQARKKFDLLGMRIFILGLRGLNPHFSEKDKFFDAEFKPIFISTAKLTQLFGNTKYLADLKPACKRLFDAVIEIDRSDGGFTLYHLFRKLDYVPNEGLHIWFEELLRPYILDLFESKGYTRINVEYLFKLSSPYAMRLLELLLQYQNIKLFKETKEIKRTLVLEDLRFALNVSEEAYSGRIDNFRKYVLDDPIREINSRTPYIVRYETIKEGRRIVAFEFVMDTSNAPTDESYLFHKSIFENDAVKLLCSLGFDEKSAEKIFRKCSDVQDCCLRVNRAVELLNKQKKPVKNKLGFLRKAIEEKWKTNGQSPRLSADEVEAVLVDSGQAHPKNKFYNLRVGEQIIPYSVVISYIRAIRKGEHLDLVKEGLKEFNVTFERFTKLCEKYGI